MGFYHNAPRAQEDTVVESWKPYLVMQKQLHDGSWAGILVRVYNTQILIGLDDWGYADAY